MNMLELTYAHTAAEVDRALAGKRALPERADLLRRAHELLELDVLVEVTLNDIITGRKGDCSFCPVSRAVRRATNRDVMIDAVSIRVFGTWLFVDIPPPPQARTFIKRFDSGGPVQPLAFRLTIPLPNTPNTCLLYTSDAADE